MRPDMIVAYAYQADLYHPTCVVDVLVAQGAEVEEGPDVEEMLDQVASDNAVDRYAEETFDSDEFPKVVFADQIQEREQCGGCGGYL